MNMEPILLLIVLLLYVTNGERQNFFFTQDTYNKINLKPEIKILGIVTNVFVFYKTQQDIDLVFKKIKQLFSFQFSISE